MNLLVLHSFSLQANNEPSEQQMTAACDNVGMYFKLKPGSEQIIT